MYTLCRKAGVNVTYFVSACYLVQNKISYYLYIIKNISFNLNPHDITLFTFEIVNTCSY